MNFRKAHLIGLDALGVVGRDDVQIVERGLLDAHVSGRRREH